MIEVFKTNVTNKYYAEMLVISLQKFFPGYTANFDLEDCDRILRVKCWHGSVDPSEVVDFLRDFDFQAEVLPDDNPNLVLESSGFELMMRSITEN